MRQLWNKMKQFFLRYFACISHCNEMKNVNFIIFYELNLHFMTNNLNSFNARNKKIVLSLFLLYIGIEH